MTSIFLKTLYDSHKETRLKNRYVHQEHIHPLIENLKNHFEIEGIGISVLGEPIHSIKIGTGPKKILLWSQMHGNESTTTKALFDICNVFVKDSSVSIQQILKNCTLVIVPILNPDGAKRYTRLNANDIDLNRDAKNLSQPESQVLRGLFDEIKPDYCFNLHGQRTIFGAGNNANSAILSFLSPAQDETCAVTETRKKAMEVIVATNNLLHTQIPNQIGIYDDAYNGNCVGDTFQSLNCPTILFEAGHFKNDYNREVTRFYMFQAILFSIDYISKNKVDGVAYEAYLGIPQNCKNHFDIIIRDAKMLISNEYAIFDVAVQYQEVLKDNKIEFIPMVEKIGDLKTYFGHKEIFADGEELTNENHQNVVEGIVLESLILKGVKYSTKLV
ncbi:M14 family zinc carboxypeptidase [Bizionia arctica]|uniref:Peptidase M14 n=1 Tax=Bizionia arctica TaxID=1495645 RepID=A0A917LNZ5_9FLAO|nr:M14 family zinc carboxypeptidase [Bizionia arctica]GGG48587.1 peptidase M14 [Bizionia arctica]